MILDLPAAALSAATTVAGRVADLTAGWAEQYADAARWFATLTRCVP